MQSLRNPGIFRRGKDPQEWRAHDAQQRNAGGAKQERAPDFGSRSRPFVGCNHEPKNQ
jgi:hypothetical protein